VSTRCGGCGSSLRHSKRKLRNRSTACRPPAAANLPPWRLNRRHLWQLEQRKGSEFVAQWHHTQSSPDRLDLLVSWAPKWPTNALAKALDMDPAAFSEARATAVRQSTLSQDGKISQLRGRMTQALHHTLRPAAAVYERDGGRVLQHGALPGEPLRLWALRAASGAGGLCSVKD
jgi:hypothetical protein